MAKGSTWARAHWQAMAAEGYRYQDGWMIKGPRQLPVPERERRIAKTASREAAGATGYRQPVDPVEPPEEAPDEQP